MRDKRSVEYAVYCHVCVWQAGPFLEYDVAQGWAQYHEDRTPGHAVEVRTLARITHLSPNGPRNVQPGDGDGAPAPPSSTGSEYNEVTHPLKERKDPNMG